MAQGATDRASADLALPPIRTDLDSARADLDWFGVTRISGAAPPEMIAAARQRIAEQAAGEAEAGMAHTDIGYAADPIPGSGQSARVEPVEHRGDLSRVRGQHGRSDLGAPSARQGRAVVFDHREHRAPWRFSSSARCSSRSARASFSNLMISLMFSISPTSTESQFGVSKAGLLNVA